MGKTSVFAGVTLLLGAWVVGASGPAAWGGEVQAKQGYMPAATRVQSPLLDAPPQLTPERIKMFEQRDQGPGRTIVPVDPSIGPQDIRPTSPPTEPFLRPAGGTQADASPEGGPLVLFRNSALSDVGTNNQTSSRSNEPSLGVNNEVIFWSGNWYASVSDDAGQTWSFIDPADNFPADGTDDPVNGGFCCDQVVYYDQAWDAMYWLLQYVQDGSTNTQRIAVANSPADVLNNIWFVYNWTPASFGFPATGFWMDFPDLTVSNEFLYLTTNVFEIGSGTTSTAVIARFPRDRISQGLGFTYGYWVSTTRPSLRMIQRAAGTMYFAAHNSTTSIRIHRWPDSSGTISWNNVAHAAYNTGTMVAPGPDGRDWAGFAGTRILGAARMFGPSPDRLVFMWNATQGGGFAYPHVQVLQFKESDRTLISQTQIWSPDVAWLYPSAHNNVSGHLGGTIAFGGGTFYPGAAAWIADANNGWTFAPLENLVFASGNSGPAVNRWGDYLTTRRHFSYNRTWAGTGWSNVGGPNNGNAVPRYVWFGRESNGPFTCTADSQCSDGYACTADECIGDHCYQTDNLRPYGDVNHSGRIDIFDLLCVLACFSGNFSTCTFGDCDLNPCTGNGDINIFDLLAVLGGFAGNDACCGGQLSPGSFTVEHAEIAER